MATTKSTTSRSRTTKSRAPRAKADDSIVARTGRTLRDRPYASAAIATGAVTAVAAAAAGAFFFSRRDKSFKEAADELSTRVKDGFSNLAERGSKFIGVDSEDRTQAEIAEEALTLKETGKSKSTPVDDLAGEQIKSGAVAY